MTTHYISFHKRLGFPRRTIRVEFAIAAESRQQAKTIAKKEAGALKGYRYLGVN